MISNLLFFVAFFALSYLMGRFCDTRRSLRPVPIRIKSITNRRSPGDSTP